MVDVDDEITGLQRHQFFQGQRLFVLAESLLESETVVTLKQLMVGVDKSFQVFVDKSVAQFNGNWMMRHFFFPIGENVMQPLNLSGLASDNHVVIPLPMIGLQVGGDHVEVLIETGLRNHIPIDDHTGREKWFHHRIQ